MQRVLGAILLVAALALAGCGDGVAGTERSISQPASNNSISDNTRLTGGATDENGDAAEPTLPTVRDVAVHNGFAYAIVPDALVVVALDRPAEPTVAARQTLPGAPLDLAVAGNYAYVACGDSGLQVIDITKPREPETAGAFAPEGGAVTAVAVERGVALAVVRDVGVAVLDVSTPPRPAEKKLLPEGADGREVLLFNERGYVVGRDITVLDLRLPAEAKVTGIYDAPAPPASAALFGNRVITWDDSALRLLNLATPERPLLTAELASERMVIAAGADDESVTDALQVTEPPAVEPIRPDVALSPAEGAEAAEAEEGAEGDIAGGEAVLDEGNLVTPDDEVEMGAPVAELPARLVVVGDRIYLRRDDGLWLLSVGDGNELDLLGLVSDEPDISAVAASERLLVLGTAEGDLIFYAAASNDALPTRLGRVNVAAQASAAAPTGDAEGANGAPPLPVSRGTQDLLRATPAPSTSRPAGAPRP